MRRAIYLLVVIALVAAACGDDDGGSGGRSGTEQALADAIRDAMLADTEPDSPIGATEATCVGNEAVDQFGVEGLLELGITTENADPGNAFEGATEEQVDKIIDVTLSCVDFKQVFIDTITADTDVTLSDNTTNCLAEELSDKDFLRPFVTAGLRGDDVEFGDDPVATQQVASAILGCMTPEELSQFGNS